MNDREKQLRELFERVTRAGNNVAAEYNLLSVADTAFLLDLLDAARAHAQLLEKGEQRDTGYHAAARGIADLVVEKQAAYGDSFGKSGVVMSLLYPEGVKHAQLADALTVVRVLDKLFRIATKRDAFGEDPWRDVLGYALLAVERQNRQTEHVAPSGAAEVSQGTLDIGQGTNWRCVGISGSEYRFERDDKARGHAINSHSSDYAWAELRRREGLPAFNRG